MIQLEYRTHITPHKYLQRELNEFAKEGWRLVSSYLYDPWSRSDDRTVAILEKVYYKEEEEEEDDGETETVHNPA